MDTADLIRLVDSLEDAGYVSLEDVQARVGDVSSLVAEHVLLVDYRTRLDGTQVTLCRLNRRHPDVIRLTAW